MSTHQTRHHEMITTTIIMPIPTEMHATIAATIPAFLGGTVEVPAVGNAKQVMVNAWYLAKIHTHTI